MTDLSPEERTCIEYEHQLAMARQALVAEAEQKVLADLIAAGRLLPEGSKALRSEYQVRWYGRPSATGGDGFVDWGCETVDDALKLLEEPPPWAVRGEIRAREHYVTPWTVVEAPGGSE